MQWICYTTAFKSKQKKNISSKKENELKHFVVVIVFFK